MALIAPPHAPMGPSQVYRGAVEFRRAEVLSMERLERLGGSAAELPAPQETMKGGRAKSLRPLSALKMPRCKVGRSWCRYIIIDI